MSNISWTENLIDNFFDYVDSNGLLKVLPAQKYKELGNTGLAHLLRITGSYVVPTEELIDALDELIDPDDNAIEICAGNGVIGRELQLTLTDSKIQERPDIQQHYLNISNPPIIYPGDVEKLEAVEAAKKYNPDVVLACFGTHKYKPGLKSGFIEGVDYYEVFKYVKKKIILVGNDRIHGDNPFMKVPHRTVVRKGILSRTLVPGVLTKIYIWEKKKKSV